MAEISVAASGIIGSPAELVYRILADYRVGHPSILPPQYFQNLTVERGGVGAGTVIRFEMKAFGSVRRFRAEIAEPEPGRVLVERDLDTGIVTTFTVEPTPAAAATVTIATNYSVPGLKGVLTRLMAPPFLRAVYRAELGLLAERAEKGRPDVSD